MTGNQEEILKELIEKYFSGGNAGSEVDDIALKNRLDVIKNFVEKNFPA